MIRDWDGFFLELADSAAQMSTCIRRDVGCVLTLSHEIKAIGFNGVPAGKPHCKDNPCHRQSTHCRAIHAEINAILRLNGQPFDTCYVSCTPCIECMKVLTNAGLQRVVAHEVYDGDAIDYFDGTLTLR